MNRLIADCLYGTGAVLRGLSWLLAAPSQLLIWFAEPIARAANRCLEKAREWDPRLQERGQHTDLRPPPRS